MSNWHKSTLIKMMTAFMKVLKKSFFKPTLTFAPTLAILNNIHATQAKPFSQPQTTQSQP